jgi:hypothetical protein
MRAASSRHLAAMREPIARKKNRRGSNWPRRVKCGSLEELSDCRDVLSESAPILQCGRPCCQRERKENGALERNEKPLIAIKLRDDGCTGATTMAKKDKLSKSDKKMLTKAGKKALKKTGKKPGKGQKVARSNVSLVSLI